VPPLFAEVPADERGVRRGLRTRRAVLSALVVVPVLALIGLIGQRAAVSHAQGVKATLELRAPKTVRGGLFFEARVTIRARARIQHPRLVLDEGWFEGMQFNTDEPQPQSESSRDGRVVLAYSTLLPGDVWQIYFQFQVNPTNVGRRSFGIELDDDTTRVARIDRSMTVLP
jgi:hypothetical protein